MRQFILLICVLALAGGALHLTNPDEAAFSSYLAEYVQQELADDAPGETEWGRKLRSGIGKIAGAAGSKLSARQDWGIASLYTLEMGGETHRFLGVAGQFLPLKGG
jgi:hypothetical protein